MSVERVGISFEPELLSRFDRLLSSQGYRSRSEAIRDLVRRAILESELRELKGDVVGSLTIIYNHDEGDVNNRLLHLQHQHGSEICSTIHVHLNEHMCLEVLVLRGRAEDIVHLADEIRALKGVKHGELVTTKPTIR